MDSGCCSIQYNLSELHSGNIFLQAMFFFTYLVDCSGGNLVGPNNLCDVVVGDRVVETEIQLIDVNLR